MSQSDELRARWSEARYAFVPSMREAHAVARHIVLTFGIETIVGFNESKRGEGYVMLDPSFDVSAIVREVTGSDPIRVLSWDQIMAEPDGFGVLQNL